jgi:hypothetical protein
MRQLRHLDFIKQVNNFTVCYRSFCESVEFDLDLFQCFEDVGNKLVRHILTNGVPIPYSITEVDNVVCFEQEQIEPIYFSNRCNFKANNISVTIIR